MAIFLGEGRLWVQLWEAASQTLGEEANRTEVLRYMEGLRGRANVDDQGFLVSNERTLNLAVAKKKAPGNTRGL